MNRLPINFTALIVVVLMTWVSCANNESSEEPANYTWQTAQDSTDRVQNISGFSGPEAVRYDPQQDVYFVANFTGDGGARDSTGFISRVSPDGAIDSLRFMTGTEEHPLHAPRGMFITGDLLWAADADGIHSFNRTTGEQVSFVDFSKFEPGFLNDIAEGPDGNLYVTDTGTSKLFKVQDNNVTVAADSLPYAPNGITLDPASDQLVLAPWGGVQTFYAWDTSDESLQEYTAVKSGGNFDGIEFVDGRLIAASQVDSSLHVINNGNDMLLIHMPGRPADIGLDTKRNQVAVPYIALNRVDIWQLPEN